MTKVAIFGGRGLKKRIGARLRHAGMEIEHVSARSRGHDAFMPGHPDVVMLDLSSSRGDHVSPSTLKSLRAAQGAAKGDPPLLVLVAHGNAAMFASLRPLLQEGVADFVRLPLAQGEADVDEEAAEEVLERMQLLLKRTQREATDTPRTEVPVHIWLGPVPELYARSGRLDAQRVANFFGFSLAALGRAIGVSRAALHKTPDAPSLQPRLHLWHAVAGALLDLLESKKAARAWLYTPLPDFEGQTPLALMQGGQAGVVIALLRDAMAGQPC